MQPVENPSLLLRRAIRAAKAGRELQARDLLLHVVELEPENEIAWLWLVDLLDELDDRVTALENALKLNPRNIKARTRLVHLRQRQKETRRRQALKARDQVEQAQSLIEAGKRQEALQSLLQIVEQHEETEKAWWLLSGLVEDQGDQIIALENVLTLNPDHKQARERLETIKHFRDNPFDLAARFEEQGEFDQALETYHRAAMRARSRSDWDTIYQNIDRLERRQASGIRYIPPVFSIARLTSGPSLLYVLLIFVHNGLNPFVFTPGLWLGALAALLGGFLIAVAGVRTRHPIWVKVFGEPGGSGSPLARFTLSLAGWFLVLLAFIFLLLSSLERMPDLEAFLR